MFVSSPGTAVRGVVGDGPMMAPTVGAQGVVGLAAAEDAASSPPRRRSLRPPPASIHLSVAKPPPPMLKAIMKQYAGGVESAWDSTGDGAQGGFTTPALALGRRGLGLAADQSRKSSQVLSC